MSNVFDALANDRYKPANLKPSLAQYDNYQIYDIHCIDRLVNIVDLNGNNGQQEIKRTAFLAVQAYNPSVIKCDFNAITQAYS